MIKNCTEMDVIGEAGAVIALEGEWWPIPPTPFFLSMKQMTEKAMAELVSNLGCSQPILKIFH